MEKSNSYCNFVNVLPDNNVHKIYHDTQYGFQIDSDNELFGRLILEINQAGLSWNTILNKQNNLRIAFSYFDIQKIANYNEVDIVRLLSDSGIIRNKLKIESIIFNAQKIVDLQNESHSFYSWLESHYPMELKEWIKLFKKVFKFTGREITKEFLTSTGYLKGAHIESCPIFQKVSSHNYLN